MDFQWENAHGPVAEDSPWRVHTTRTAAEQVTPSKTRTSPSAVTLYSSARADLVVPVGSQAPAFQASPSKPSALAFTTPSKSNLHNFQSRPTPATLHKQIFATPRQYESPSKADYSDFSTPGDPMDTESEAPTPDPHLNHILHRNPRTIARVLQQSPTRVTGRGEIRKSRDDDRISKEHRSLRHRRRRSRRSYDYSDEDDSDDSDFYDRRRSRSRRSHARSRSRSHLLLDEPGPAPRTAAGSDGWRPKDISDWIQIIFNLGVLGSIFFYGCAFIWTIQADVRNRVEAETGSVIQTIAQCQKDYLTNRCSPPIQRVPAMEEICNKWELCMNMDPHKVGWAKIAAVTLAEIFNGFAHTLTYKSMVSPTSSKRA